MDDAILGGTAPFVALCLSLAHGLPRALNRVQFEKDLRMPLPRRKGDKARHSLSFMLLHPADSGRRRRYPTILVRNPYGRLTFFYTFYLFAQRGYNVVVQDVRGRGESTGVFDCIHDEEDAQATLEWITSQPWYSPEYGIGCLGTSSRQAVKPSPALTAVNISVCLRNSLNFLYPISIHSHINQA